MFVRGGYDNNFCDIQDEKSTTKLDILWLDPKYSKDVNTMVDEDFLELLDKHVLLPHRLQQPT